jgi:hypothetical protein
LTTNKIQEAFDQVHASEAMKTAILTRVSDPSATWAKRRPIGSRWWYAVGGAAVILLALFVGLVRTPAGYLSLDVNPSIELTVNRFDRVIAATGRNDDGTTVLKATAVTGQDYRQALETLLTSEAMQPYLTDANALTVTVACDDPQRRDAMLAAVGDCPAYQQLQGHCAAVSTSLLAEAHDCGLSFGKYNAYLTLHHYEPELTVEDCHDMTMGELCQRIADHQDHDHQHESPIDEGQHEAEEEHDEEDHHDEDSGEHHDHDEGGSHHDGHH